MKRKSKYVQINNKTQKKEAREKRKDKKATIYRKQQIK